MPRGRVNYMDTIIYTLPLMTAVNAENRLLAPPKRLVVRSMSCVTQLRWVRGNKINFPASRRINSLLCFFQIHDSLF